MKKRSNITGKLTDEEMVQHYIHAYRLLMKMWFDITGKLTDEEMVQHYIHA